MKRQDNLNGGKCGSVVNLGFDGFQHLFLKADLVINDMSTKQQVTAFYSKDSFQVISVAQKHNFDSFWPGRQK